MILNVACPRKDVSAHLYNILFCVVVKSYMHIPCTCTSFDIARLQCLWKLCRHLPDAINDMDVERSLMHVHHFMKAHPASSWAQRDNDMPLRTVKTIVHTLAKLKGAKVASPRSSASHVLVPCRCYMYMLCFVNTVFVVYCSSKWHVSIEF